MDNTKLRNAICEMDYCCGEGNTTFSVRPFSTSHWLTVRSEIDRLQTNENLSAQQYNILLRKYELVESELARHARQVPGEVSVYGTRRKEAVELAAMLDGMHEGSYDLESLYVTEPVDDDCFIARAADLLREFASTPASSEANKP